MASAGDIISIEAGTYTPAGGTLTVNKDNLTFVGRADGTFTVVNIVGNVVIGDPGTGAPELTALSIGESGTATFAIASDATGDTDLAVHDGTVTLGANALALPADVEIAVEEGTVSGSPVFGGAVNVAYIGANSRTAGGELPANLNGGDLSVLFTAADETLTLGQATTVGDNVTVNANSTVVGTLVVTSAATFTGPGNAGNVEVTDGSVTLASDLALTDVFIANVATIDFDIAGNTLTITGDFTRQGGDFSYAAGGTLAFMGDDADATFTPGPNFEVETITVDKDGQTLTITDDVDLTASGGGNAFIVATNTTVSNGGEQINLLADGLIDVDGSLASLSQGGVFFNAPGATISGDGIYSNLTVTTSPVGDVLVSGEVDFAGRLALISGGVDASAGGADLSPSGTSASVTVTATSAAQRVVGSFNADNVDYNLTYSGAVPGGGLTVGQEFAPNDIRNVTFNTTANVLTLANLNAGGTDTISGNFTMGAAALVALEAVADDLTIAGVLSIADDATLSGGAAGNSVTLSGDGTSHSIVGKITATTTLVLDATDIAVTGSTLEDGDTGADGDEAEITNLTVADGASATVTNIQRIDGNLLVDDDASDADASLMLTLLDEQSITGDVQVDGSSFTLGSNVGVAGDTDVNAGSFDFMSYIYTSTGTDFDGAADVTYAADGGWLRLNNAGHTFGLNGETLPGLQVSADATLTSDVVVSTLFVEDGGTITNGGNDLSLAGALSSDGGTVVQGAGNVFFDTATLTLSGDAVIDAPTEVNDSQTLTLASDDDDNGNTVRELFVDADFTLDGTVDLDDNDLWIDDGNLENDAGTVLATTGELYVVGGNNIEPNGTQLDIPNLATGIGAAVNIGVTSNGAVRVTETLELDVQINENDADDNLIIAEGVEIEVNVNNPIVDEPTFEGPGSVTYEVVATTGNEIPDDGGVVNMTLNAPLTTDQDVSVSGTLTLDAALDNTANDDVFTLGEGATMVLQQPGLLGASDITATIYNLTYDYMVSSAITSFEFLSGATVETLTIDVGDGAGAEEELDLDMDRTAQNVVVSDGNLDLAGNAFTIEGDFTLNNTSGGAGLISSAADAWVIFGGDMNAMFSLGAAYTVPASLGFKLDKDTGSYIMQTGGNIDFATNTMQPWLASGSWDTGASSAIILFQNDTTQGFQRDEEAGDSGNISGNIRKSVAAGDPFGAGRSARYEFPAGSPMGEYRPAAITFRNNIATATNITVNHQDMSPEGTAGLPLDGGDGVSIGNYPDFYWLFRASTSLGSSQLFDVEITGTQIGFPYEDVNDLRIIRRFDGDATTNAYQLQGAAAEYSNIQSIVGSDTTAVIRVENSQGGLVTQGARYTLGIPVRTPIVSLVVGDSLVAVEDTTFAINEGDTLNAVFEADARDIGQEATIAMSDLPENATFDPETGEFSFTPDFTQAGTYNPVITATDPDGEAMFTLTINVANVNFAPQFVTELPDTTFIGDNDTLTVALEAEDVDEETLTYSILETVENATLDGSTFTFSPNFEQADSVYSFTAVVEDPNAATDTLRFAVAVGFGLAFGDVDGDGAVTTADAQIAFSSVFNRVTLTDGQVRAADADDNGTIDTFDAFLIFRRAVRNICLPVEEEGTDDCTLESAGKGHTLSSAASGRFEWGAVSKAEETGFTLLPLKLADGARGVNALTVTLTLDAAQVAVKDVQFALPEGWMSGYRFDEEAGTLKIAAFGLEPIGDGDMAIVSFEKKSDQGQVAVRGEGYVNANPVQVLEEAQLAELPKEFALRGNYPNPFNPTTNIVFDLPETAEVSVEIYDMLGRRVMMLAKQEMQAGAARTVQVDAMSLASGMYVYRVVAEAGEVTHVKSGQMMLIK